MENMFPLSHPSPFRPPRTIKETAASVQSWKAAAAVSVSAQGSVLRVMVERKACGGADRPHSDSPMLLRLMEEMTLLSDYSLFVCLLFTQRCVIK